MKTVSVNYGTNYHVEKITGGYNVYYTDKDVLYKQTLKQNENTCTAISFCHEEKMLHDGMWLKRIGENLVILER